MAASMGKCPFRILTRLKGQLLKQYTNPQVIQASHLIIRGKRLPPWKKGPELNKPGYETPAHGPNVKRLDGEFVHSGEVLVTQTGLQYYPGENVDIERTNRLIAMCDGVVMITTETLNPYPDSPLYGPVSQGVEIKKKFLHIRPIPLHGKFKLVNEI